MANELPDYRDRMTINGPALTINPVPGFGVPDLRAAPEPIASAQALQGLGAEVAAVAQKIADGVQHTRATEAMSGFLSDNDALTKQYLDDKDYATSEERYRKDIEAKKLQRLEAIDDQQLRARTELDMKRAVIRGAVTIRAEALTRQKDIAHGSLLESEANLVRLASSAPSDVERMSYIQQQASNVERNRSVGWIGDTEAVQFGQRFKQKLDTADATRITRDNPAEALRRLADPTQFASLDPVTRQSFIAQAQEKAENGQITTVVQHAKAGNAVSAALTVGRVETPEQSGQIFDQVIVRIESDGKVDAVSSAGALGLSQIMPATAREMARRLGMSGIAALPDDELKTRLLSDGRLNVQLGKAYWSQMVTRYDGNVALAAVAYNAGPGNADRWKAAAEAKYGASFTPSELQSVIPGRSGDQKNFQETRDYLGKVYAASDAPMDVRFSLAGQARASASIGSVLTQQQAESARQFAIQASAVAATNPIDQMTQAGMNAKPEEWLAFEAAHQRAADAGDEKAAARLAAARVSRQRAPYVDQMYGMAPAQMDAVIAATESEAYNAPNGTSAQTFLKLQAYKGVRDEVVKLRDTNPIALGERAKLYPAVAVDPTANPDSSEFREALSARGAQATVVQRRYLGSAAALKPEEAAALKERYETGTSDDKFRVVQALAATLPEQVYKDTLKQIAGDDAGTQFVGQIAQRRPELAREIFKGMALANTEGVKTKIADVRAVLNETLGGDVYVGTGQQDAVIGAGVALYVARSAATGELYGGVNHGALRRALEDVAGTIVKRNGARTAIPPGMTAGQFNGVLDNLNEQSFDQFGGAHDRNGKPYSAAFLSANARLRQLEPGSSQYMVVLPQGPGGKDVPVWQAPDPNVPRAPLIIDMTRITGRDYLTRYQRGDAAFRAELGERLQAARRESETAP